MGLYTQVVTSAVRPVPAEWIGLRRLKMVVSIDGLQPEHDERRKPATYERILKHIKGHQITVHCTVTRQQSRRDGYLEEFVRFWSKNPDTGQIWISLYTPQIGEDSDERLTPADRERVVAALMHLRKGFPKLTLPAGLIEVYARPPESPDDCIFAQTTTCVSADFERHDFSVSVRREARLLQLRLHRLGRTEGGRTPPAAWRSPGGRGLRAFARSRTARTPRARIVRSCYNYCVWRISHRSTSRQVSIFRKSITPSTRPARKWHSATTSRDRARQSISIASRTR